MTNVDLQGRLANDPQTFPAGDSTVTRLRVIAQQSAAERERDDPAFGVDVEAWGQFGHALGQLHKGDPIVILGTWKVATWTDRTSGESRTKNFVRAYAGGPDLNWADITGLTRRSSGKTSDPQNPQPQPTPQASSGQTTTVGPPPSGPDQLTGTHAGPIDPFDE